MAKLTLVIVGRLSKEATLWFQCRFLFVTRMTNAL